MVNKHTSTYEINNIFIHYINYTYNATDCFK